MKILSIDVGIKNLAFCLFKQEDKSGCFKITLWDTINVSEQETLNCSFHDKNGICNKPAKFKKENICFCLKHAKKQNVQIPPPELKQSFINTQKMKKLQEIACLHNITQNATKIKKPQLLSLIKDHIYNHYLQEIPSTKASDVNLYEIGKNIKIHFDKLFAEEKSFDYVIIENQISPIANRMKTIQGMLVQYFIMCHIDVQNIEFISASNKLKDCDIKDKKEYGNRKKLGISKCLEIMSTDDRFSNKIDFFKEHKKKDDLADSFLQGLWFINNTEFV
jgi:hypothetical protein